MRTDLYSKSVEVIRKYQSEYGSFVACPNFPVYRFCWLRDGTYIAYAMDVAGEYDSALRFYRWVDETVKRYAVKLEVLMEKKKKGVVAGPNEHLHTRYQLNGRETREEWGNKQFDGYASWLWGLVEHVKLTSEESLMDDFTQSVETTVNYLVNFWDEPCFDCWEELPDKIHTNTLGCISGGLEAINQFLKRKDVEKCVKQVNAFINKKCTIQGRLAKFYDPKTKRASGVDSNLLLLDYPFHVFEPDSKVFKETVKEIERKLLTDGVHRHPKDSYYGGGEWIILTLWLARHYHEVGRREEAYKLLKWTESNADVNGEIPEQVPRNLNKPRYYAKWLKNWGPIAKPLLWSHAMYIVAQSLFNQQ